MISGLLAVFVNRYLPERKVLTVPVQTPLSIDYEVLEQGTNLADLERGRVYYVQLCVSCHGVRGDGRGEWAYRVAPLPSDLTGASVQRRSDEYLFNAISDGLVGTPMVSLKNRLSEPQRWQLVAFVRHLGVHGTQSGRDGS